MQFLLLFTKTFLYELDHITFSVEFVFLFVASLSCPRDDFNCDEDKCIDKSKKCDGKQDCEDGTDEHYCRKDELFNWIFIFV